MRRSAIFTRQSAIGVGTLAIASVLAFAVVVPPAPERLDTQGWSDLAARTAPGAYHIHTARSDGVGDKRDVARAAARAGLTFVILTDHGDATRPPDPPGYLEGVLCLDAVEISTDDGHYVAIDMPRAPYPLGGAAEAVVEDVARLGGFGIAAHPDSPKRPLRWTDARLRVDGFEWLNLDSEWRDESRRSLARAGLAYFVRPAPALATLLDRPATLDRWDRMTAVRRVVGLAGIDAHGGVGSRLEDPNRSLPGTIGIPGYEASFRTFSTRVVLERPLSGNADADAKAIYGAIRKGSVFTGIDALAGPGLLDFRADGDTLVARATMPRGAEMVLLRNGGEAMRGAGEVRYDSRGAPGAYRVEVRIPHAPGTPPIPWLVSNPMYLGIAPEAPRAPLALRAPLAPQTIPPFPWRIEKDPASSGILRTSGGAVELEYKLAEGERRDQVVALATDTHGDAFKAVDLTLFADRPSRVWLQVRSAGGERWGKSFYVDEQGTAVHAALAELRPIGDVPPGAVDSAAVTSVLIAIDLTNAAPGRTGRLRITSSALVK